jgi:hypothetical protein
MLLPIALAAAFAILPSASAAGPLADAPTIQLGNTTVVGVAYPILAQEVFLGEFVRINVVASTPDFARPNIQVSHSLSPLLAIFASLRLFLRPAWVPQPSMLRASDHHALYSAPQETTHLYLRIASP